MKFLKLRFIEEMEGTMIRKDSNTGFIGKSINMEMVQGHKNSVQLLFNYRIVSWAVVNFFEK